MLAGVAEIHQTMLSQIAALEDHSLEFLFSSKNHPYLDRDAITVGFEREWETFGPFLEPEKQRRSVANLLFPDRPYDLKVMQELRYAFQTASVPSPIIALDLCIRAVLTQILDKYSKEVTPQLIIELLNPYKLRTPEFLIIIKPIIHIIIDRDKAYNRIVKSHACEVLINNFEIETLFIYISCSPDLQEEEKQVLFQSLTAFQKIYRKLLELHVGIPEKDRISLRWFGVSFTQLKRQGEWRDSFSNMVRRFVQYLKERNKRDAVNVGRFLVLRFNNEDILRVIHYEISRDPVLSPNKPIALFIFRQIFRIMQEFRRQYISQKVDEHVTQALSETEAQAMDAMHLVTVGRVPARVILRRFGDDIPSAKDHPILPEFMERLGKFNLKALFELYSIPPLSQQVFKLVADIAENTDLGRDEIFHFITYLETLLIFLQDLEEIDIKIVERSTYGLLKNPYQLKTLNLIEEGAYFASTGLWYQNTIPPSIIRCISPNAIPNCLGVMDRHIFSGISLLTGGFRGSPFDLDSTHRYDWDEEPETCLFRPGYFNISIPSSVSDRWEETQSIQKAMLHELIQEKQWN